MLKAIILHRRALWLLASAKAAQKRGEPQAARGLRDQAVVIIQQQAAMWASLMSEAARPPLDAVSLEVVVSPAAVLSDQVGLAASVSAADRLRDAEDFAAAAQAYSEILEQAPDRVDIRVQFGNMLKDSGQLQAAEAAYRNAISARPQDADPLVQLGHVLKLLGKRTEAGAVYRRALLLDPSCAPAALELAALGDAAEQERMFEAHIRRGSTERLFALSGNLAELRKQLDKLAESLPEFKTLGALPVALYSRFRDLFPVPAPPPQQELLDQISIVLLADREKLSTLYRQLAAIRGQTHENWRLIALGSTPDRRDAILRAAASDPRITWLELVDPPAEAELLAASTHAGTALLLGASAVLDANALTWFATAMRKAEAAAFVCDEEVATHDRGRLRYSAPVLRPLVDYDTLLERNVFGETIALKTTALRELAPRLQTGSPTSLRVSLLLELAMRGMVGHIPFPLVWHDEAVAPVPDPHAYARIVAHHLDQAKSAASLVDFGGAPEVRIASRANPARIAVIVPTRDNALDVRALVSSLRETAEDPSSLDILVLDNGGTDAAETAALERMEESGAFRLRVIDEPFNWSRLNTLAVALTDDPILVFVNDDMQMLSKRWDVLLRGLLARPEVGAVGARLLYPDDTIQHAGIIFGWFPSPTHHDGLHESATEPGPAWRWHVTRAVSAVTGAFLATSRDLFLSVGGFDEVALPIGYSDIDYALKLRAIGRKVLWTPHITLHHVESKTRGIDSANAARTARNDAERDLMLRRWPDVLDSDPSVHPIWHPATLPFRLLQPYSADRAVRYIQATAARHPWLVPSPVVGIR